MTARRSLGASLLALALALALGVPAAAQPGAATASAALAARVDALVRDGYEHPAAALAALQAMQRAPGISSDEQRVVLQALGSIEAQDGAASRAGALADQLLALARDDPSGRAAAAANLVHAEVAETAGQLGVAAALAQAALPAFERGCAQPVAKRASVDAPVCDYRSAWRALQILERRALAQGVPATATAHAQAALMLAERAGDARRESSNLSALAWYAQQRGEPALAKQLLARARRLAVQIDDPAQLARVSSAEAEVANLQGDPFVALQSWEAARAQAQMAHAPRLEAQMLNSLSDAYADLGQPAQALQAAQRGLVAVRRHHDVRVERLLLGNAGIAKIGLGRIAEGKQDLEQLLVLWQQSGDTGQQARALSDFGVALAAAGDARSALALYHRERALSAELMRVDRSAALKELQTRNDAAARQREIELLGRDNALKTAELANRKLLQRIGWVLAAVMLLAITLAALLYRRVRETHQQLAASQVQLQAQSERDPLTNLANRRHFQAVMTRLCGTGGFEGALLLVDLDHFKHVNDVYGHAAGDLVLVEVARRLNDAVRGDDLVVRWGGEEFLILAPRASAQQAEQIAQRVLRIVALTPIDVGAQRIQVTTSIGHARFPLPPHTAVVPWEQAINLADMALYTAKNQGRNRAVGITASTAATAEALRAVEADFDRAWHEGRVTLRQTPGPEVHGNARAA